jgi:hypothetical protein
MSDRHPAGTRLAARVTAIDPRCVVQHSNGESCIEAFRIRVSRRTMQIDVVTWRKGEREISCDFVKSRRDRAILRAVLDELDEAEGV